MDDKDAVKRSRLSPQLRVLPTQCRESPHDSGVDCLALCKPTSLSKLQLAFKRPRHVPVSEDPIRMDIRDESLSRRSRLVAEDLRTEGESDEETTVQKGHKNERRL